MARVANHLSPTDSIEVVTPPSSQGAPSPMAAVVAQVAARDRALLFGQGKYQELLQSMGRKQGEYAKPDQFPCSY